MIVTAEMMEKWKEEAKQWRRRFLESLPAIESVLEWNEQHPGATLRQADEQETED